MNLIIHMPAGKKKSFVEAITRWFIQQLKIEQSTYFLSVQSIGGYEKMTGAKAGINVEGKKILLAFDSRLPPIVLMVCLAHEMIHVAQITKGILSYRKTGKRISVFWRGQDASHYSYEDCPWEILAYSRQFSLVKTLPISLL